MKLVCRIGTQGLSDGRRISRGEVYEVDDETASILITARYAEMYVEPMVDNKSTAESVVIDEPEVVVEEPAATEIAQGESHASHFSGGVEEPDATEKKKRKYKRR